MNRLLGVSFLALALCGSLSSAKFHVDVYYESLCPDSIYFITKELAPSYNDLKDFIDVNLVPFGKSSWVTGDESNKTHFTCQHGPNECSGNRAQACALYEIGQTVKAEDQQRKMVDVVSCVMSNRNPATAVPQCAEKNGLSSESVKRIETCATSDFGDGLLISHGEKTKAFESPLAFVPTIVIDGEKKPEAFRNFAKTICWMFPSKLGIESPKICTQY